jgi:uncharacterized protein YkuJ
MQGLSVLTDPEGNPKTAMIDLQQHDSQLNPLVSGLLDLLQQQQEDDERRLFFDASGIVANASYSDDEEEYTIADLKAVNPNFNPYATR